MFFRNQYEASVIIPTYNRADLLKFTLESLRKQKNNTSNYFEVIIVDDGSSDHTKEVLKEFEHQLNLKYIYQPDRGFRVARARNLGISLAESPISIFVDSGVILKNDFIDKHISAHKDSEKQRAVIGYVTALSHENLGESSLKKSIDFEHLELSIENISLNPVYNDIREKCFVKCSDNLSSLPAPWIYFWTCNVSVSTDAIRKIKGFDEKYTSWGVEDVDLGYSLYLNGVEFSLCREAIALHYPHERDDNNRKNSKDNRHYFHQKFRTEESRLLLNYRSLEINDILSNQNKTS